MTLKKYIKKYLYYRFLLEMKEYQKKYGIKPGKAISIQIGMEFALSPEDAETLKEEITQSHPERR